MPSSSSTTTTKNNNHHHVESEQLPCPRCDSTNTKFCYYNNYNFSQPRHFCKSCRRYWTHGGALRDIPVGGGTRKSAKRQRVSSTAVSSGLEYHHISSTAAAATTAGIPVLMSFAGDHGGSFTSLLSNAQTPGIFGLDQDLSFGLGRTSWPFTGFGEGVGGAAVGGGGSTWGMESTEGGGDCFVFPDLAISTQGKYCNAMK